MRGPGAAAIPSLTPDDSMHGRLRRATSEQHRTLDHGLRYLQGGELSIEQYGRLLTALFGFYLPLEACLAQLQVAIPAVTVVRRTVLLERDLNALGISPAGVPVCIKMPRLATVDRLAGALYVVEGACLGGQVIARIVRRQLGLGRENGATFFIGEGARTGARWRRVLAWLDARERCAAAGHEMIDGACRTFEALAQWLSRWGVLHE